MLTKIEVDTHTHTVLSGHAWSTLLENAAAAARKGVRGMCLTEHGPLIPGGGPEYLPATQAMLPEELFGVRLYHGVEANIVDFDGSIDIGVKFLARTDFAVASMHDLVIAPGTPADNTSALVAAINNPRIDMLGHLDDSKMPSDLEAVVLETKRLDKLVEINNNSLTVRRNSRPRIVRLAELCMKHGVRAAVSSDAHFADMVGNVLPALELLNAVDFPEELLANLTKESFELYLGEKRERVR